DTIADDLIGDAAWEEGDATWDTSVKTGESARRVCHHIADDIWLSLIQGNVERQASPQAPRAKGLILVISDDWDGVNHEPFGNIQVAYVPFEGKTSAGVNADLADFQIVYKLFTGAGGFALVGVPPANATDNYQSNFIVIVERNASKLYADGFTNFYIFVDGNYFHAMFHDYACGASLFGEDVKYWKYTRPFLLQAHAEPAWQKPYKAYKSVTNGKAYFMKPILHNDLVGRTPWLQPLFWIAIDSSKANLADDDEIAMPAPDTQTYQVTRKDGPDSATYIWYAIIKTE
ncbi:unnamed protein product, partial [marine sediment metagenome]